MKAFRNTVLVIVFCICVLLISVFLPDVRGSIRSVIYGEQAEKIEEAFAGMENALSGKGGFADAVEAFCSGFSH